MNLALLDPFRRQLPDRIDATLNLPPELHYLGHNTTLVRENLALKKGEASAVKRSRVGSHQEGGDDGSVSVAGSEQIGNKKAKKKKHRTSISSIGPTGRIDDENDVEEVDEEEASEMLEENEEHESYLEINPVSKKSKLEHHPSASSSALNSNGQKPSSAKDSKTNSTKTEGLLAVLPEEMLQCMHVTYNRRGTYLSVGHASGTVSVWDTISRTLAALYHPSPPNPLSPTKQSIPRIPLVTCSSWTRRGRILWISKKFNNILERVDLTHDDPDFFILNTDLGDDASVDGGLYRPGVVEYLPLIHVAKPHNNSSGEHQNKVRIYGEFNRIMYLPNSIPCSLLEENESQIPKDLPKACRRVHTQVMDLPRPLNAKTGAVAHPRDDQTAILVLSDGSLVLVYCPPFEDTSDPSWEAPREDQLPSRSAKMLYLIRSGGHRSSHTLDNKKTHVNCATFNPTNGSFVYAICANGLLLCFKLSTTKKKHIDLPPYRSTLILEVPTSNSSQNIPEDSEPRIPRKDHATSESVDIPIQTHEIVSSRHGDMVVVNCFAGGQLKLYDTKVFDEAMIASSDARANERQTSPGTSKNRHQNAVQTLDLKPRYVFSDPVEGSKTAFVSCDFSGDGEYLIGACNSSPQPGDKYELYVWNTSTGTMLDRLTGPQTILNSVCFHPVKSFISAGSYDGIVDVWGPRLDWTAFAPDFQALPCNVEYVEREDEFDEVVLSHNEKSDAALNEQSISTENNPSQKDGEVPEDEINVVLVDRIPVFDSDSEEEEDVFYFQTKVKGTVSLRGRNPASHGK